MDPLSLTTSVALDNIRFSCVRYGLHKKLKLPERQASSLRDKNSVQGKATICALTSTSLTSNATRSDCLQGSSVLPFKGTSSEKRT